MAPISFNQVPDGNRVPFIYVEFDTSKAQQGPSIQQYKALLIGQRLSSGTKLENQLDLVTSEAQAKKFYGAGSMLAHMVKAFLAQNKTTGLTCVALDDAGGAVKADGNILFGGSSIKAGTLSVKLFGKKYSIGVAEGDTPETVVSNLVTEVQADEDRQVAASIDGGDAKQFNIEARHGGSLGNEGDIRTNPFQGDELPENLTAVVTAMSSGSGDPDVSSVITAMGELQFHVIGMAMNDAANLLAMETELEDRFGPIRQNDGIAFTSKNDTFSNLVTLGDSRNSPHVSILGVNGPTPVWEYSAETAGIVGKFGQIDPARPFQTLAYLNAVAPDDSEQFTFSERNLLLKDGISTFLVSSGGRVRVERLITTFQENAFGSPDTSLLNVNTLLTLSFIRFDFRTRLQNKFPRHKLAGDGLRVAPGQAIITPKIGKAEAVAIFRSWEELGLVEGIDQFKRDLIVERNASDPDRLDFLLPPDLVNQFRVAGVSVQFLL